MATASVAENLPSEKCRTALPAADSTPVANAVRAFFAARTENFPDDDDYNDNMDASCDAEKRALEALHRHQARSIEEVGLKLDVLVALAMENDSNLGGYETAQTLLLASAASELRGLALVAAAPAPEAAHV